MNNRDLEIMACKIRHHIINEVHSAKAGHPGGSLSMADIITELYFEQMNVDPKNPKWDKRDRFVLSKGHCSPALYGALGIYLPLITTNCAVLGVALLNVQEGFDFVHTLVYSFSAGISFMVAIVLFAGVRERLETADGPKALDGFPIALVTAGLLALAFLGFSGMKF